MHKNTLNIQILKKDLQRLLLGKGLLLLSGGFPGRRDHLEVQRKRRLKGNFLSPDQIKLPPLLDLSESSASFARKE